MDGWIVAIIGALLTAIFSAMGYLIKNQIKSIKDILQNLLTEMQLVREMLARQDEKNKTNDEEHRDIYVQIERHANHLQRHENDITVLKTKVH
jgi:uncharacterized membrane protein YgaE (UPF0421/DUF939 family)